jgi:hypothetical protein
MMTPHRVFGIHTGIAYPFFPSIFDHYPKGNVMLKKLIRRLIKREPEETGNNRQKRQTLTVVLEGSTLERFERLKQIIKAYDDHELIAASITCLDRKTHRIIKRRITKKSDLAGILPAAYMTRTWSEYQSKG